MKNDPVVTTQMDLTEEDVFERNDVDVKKEFIDGSSYTNDFREETNNVNTTAMEWSMRHNNDAKKCSFTWNGFQRTKAPRLTCTGRITRVPSRYLDTDSDSSDGSKAKAVVSRLKVKRRRKSSSTSNKKLLVNGYKEHDAFSLEMGGIHSDRIICNLNADKIERLGDLECPKVFEITSPVSNDKISPFTHGREAKSACQANYTAQRSESMPESLENDQMRGILQPNCIVLEHSSKSPSMSCSQLRESSVDISVENKDLARFASSNVSTGQTLQDFTCGKQTPSFIITKRELARTQVEGMSIKTPLKKQPPASDGDLSAKSNTFVVSPKGISKQNNVSCTGLKSNVSCETQEKEANCNCSLGKNEARSCKNGCFSPESALGGEIRNGSTKLELIEDALLSVTCIENGEEISRDNLIDHEKTTIVCKEECNSIKPQGLNCFRNFKMGRPGTYNARKLNQKQMRRTDRTANSNSGLKKQSLLDQRKRKTTTNKATNKTAKMHKAKLKQKDKNKLIKKNTKAVKASDQCEELDQVLGMRKNPNGDYEFLVQWTNGTSCWVSSKQVVMHKQNGLLRQYMMENEQDISVVNRVPFQAYCCDSLSLDECQALPVCKIFQKKKEVEKPKAVKEKAVPVAVKKAEVVVENLGDHCHITLNRETCKHKLTCLNIVNEFITALEDASVSECSLVVIRGLGSRVFGGLDINSLCKVGADVESGSMVLQKTRYLVQTLCNYPKPLVGLISQPAQGLGAVLLSLFDMICDEETWKKEGFVANGQGSGDSIETYCLPRVVGHSLPCEEILMGKNCADGVVEGDSLVSDTAVRDSSDNSIVMGTLKEIEATINKLGKKTKSLVDMSDDEIFKMTVNQMTNIANASECIEMGNSFSDEDSKMLNGTITEDSLLSSSCDPADRYMRELESKIFEEKQLVKQYVDEISNIWNTPSFTVKDERS